MSWIINWIATDGLLHALVSALIFIVCFSFIEYWSIILTVLIGVSKEIYDILKKPDYTWEMVCHDLVCDIGGIILGIVLSLIIF